MAYTTEYNSIDRTLKKLGLIASIKRLATYTNQYNS